MLLTAALVLLVLWAIGLATGFTLNGFIHVLLALAIIAIIYNLFTGRRVM